ncbi:interferon gamma receptor 2 isoform X2 [Toxotes jaculatrix]|nr:interferon gamma receptor 2 isoform X2 [Toxotes jaculatrix]
MWTPATEERDLTYTVQYSSFNTKVWQDVPACIQTPFNSCNVAFTKDQSQHGCVKLRVRAERRGLKSIPVKACSRHSDTCSPEVNLTARPGSLTVYLNKNNSLTAEHAAHVKHRVYYGKEGESLERMYEDGTLSVSISNLEEGQRYCTKVQYLYYSDPIGLERCTQCEVIPKSRHKAKETEAIVAVVVVVVLVALMTSGAYFLIFQRRRIKQWLQPPCEIPPHFLLEPFPEHHISALTSSPTEGRYDIISSIE